MNGANGEVARVGAHANPGEPLDAIWGRAQSRERAGDLEAALAGYALLVELKLDGGQPIPALLCERLAAVCVELGEHQAAVRVLAAARGRMQSLGDDYGVFVMTLRLAQASLRATDLESAELFLRDAFAQRQAIAARGPEALGLLDLARRLGWRGRDATETAIGRVDASLTLARFWAAVGGFEAAASAAELALELLPGAGGQFSATAIGLFLAELHLDRGDLAGAAGAERRHGPQGTGETEDQRRWALLGARRACLEGRLSAARQALELAHGRGEEPPARLELQAAWMLATLLGQLNRVGDAQRLLQHTASRLAPDRARGGLARDLEALSQLLGRKREGASRELALPFVPEQAWRRGAIEDDDDAPSPAPPPAARPAPGGERRVERFADRWAIGFNDVLLLLDGGDLHGAAAHLPALESLGARSDSPRIAARTRYLRALIDYHRGDYAAARAAILECLDGAREQGLALDELQYLDLASLVLARIERLEEYQRCAAEARALLGRLLEQLDGEDRVYWTLNKMSQQDTYLSARIDSLRWIERSSFPIGAVADWLSAQRLRRETLRCYREMSCLVGWDIDRRLEGEDAGAPGGAGVLSTPEAADSSDQVEAWVRFELGLTRRSGRGARRRSLADRRWPLLRIPRGMAILQYYAVADRLFAFLLTRGSISIRVLRTTRIELGEAVSGALLEIMQQNYAGIGPRRVDQALRRLAADVGITELLRPLIGAIEHLVIIPHDVLVHAPFSALPCGGEERLCERFVIRSIPSLRWLDPGAAIASRPIRPGSFLGVAVREHPGMPPLRRPLEEVQRAATLLPGACRRTILADGDAVPGAILAALERSEWAHFACHGLFDRAQPHRSRMLVSGPDGAGGEIALAEIQRKRLDRLRVAVLASCWTSGAAVLPGGELVCLPAAFLRAGARGVLAPLWMVDDVQSAVFMADFYRAAAESPPPQALARVQRAWLRSGDGRRSTAFHWAAYIHHGSG
ncbi:CHAT domain-containing protein [Sorangium sp. So ce1389]|uniref:CHAT domain-containing protein n=1 Tax=Sorangium sp. So ce1389 TaxID=3133336 RepID=UPI003F5F7077